MSKNVIIAGVTGAIALVSVTVIAAQHPGSTAPVSHQPAVHHMQLLHAACSESGSGGQQSHVPAHMAKALDLSAAQLTQIDRVATEACREMKRTHERMMAILTAEQRAKVQELHKRGDDRHSDGVIMDLMKKLHGRR